MKIIQKRTLFLLIAVMVLFGCISQIKPIDQWTPKEQAVYFMGVYTDEYDNYMRMSKLTSLSEEQKVILRKKKIILTEMYGPIKMYMRYVDTGRIPTEEMYDYIMEKLTALEVLLLEEVSNG